MISRRSFLAAGAALVGSRPLRGIGLAVAEGFSDTRYLTGPGSTSWGMKVLAAGEIDITVTYGTNLILQVDAGDPVVLLGGIHVGCYELFGGERVRAVRDLRGRKVAVPELGSGHHIFVSMMASHVGLDPRKDIEWVLHKPGESGTLLVEAKVDALMAFPPEAQELRAKKIGHVVGSSAVDRPWSQYFCCMIGSGPNKIIAQGTDWRFFNELKKELKG